MTCLLVSFIFHTVEQSRQAVTKKEFLPLGQTVYVSKVRYLYRESKCNRNFFVPEVRKPHPLTFVRMLITKNDCTDVVDCDLS